MLSRRATTTALLLTEVDSTPPDVGAVGTGVGLSVDEVDVDRVVTVTCDIVLGGGTIMLELDETFAVLETGFVDEAVNPGIVTTPGRLVLLHD
ncbi:hypothetical protein BDN70DRAFT_872389 [Pholiota conissans]|uniref:Uncharacterized protein n=1 Tax=Pholiota conissans TaxID=109636 RepID=A0A9P5ZEU7_9AGAR|nr:hypothetical protein BDN70DRAFT_872389 [Pholiota conissans]